MAEPITNFEATYTQIYQEGKTIDTIRMDFQRRIFTDHANDYFYIYKYAVPVATFDMTDYINYRGNILKFMNDSHRMGKGTYMGGFDPGVPPEILDMTSNIQKGAQYLLDEDVSSGFVYIYEFIYQYEDVQYSTIDLASLDVVPFQQVSDLVSERRRCLNYRNFRYRGNHPTEKYREMFNEIHQDLKTWESNISGLTTIVDDVILYDEQLFKVYFLEDTIRYIIEEGTAFGYGVGKYGAKGGYGI